jgi:hypothetical protein
MKNSCGILFVLESSVVSLAKRMFVNGTKHRNALKG